MSGDPQVSRLDFSELPLRQATALLQQVGRGLALGVVREEVPALSTLVQPQAMSLFSRPSAWWLQRHDRAALRRAPRWLGTLRAAARAFPQAVAAPQPPALRTTLQLWRAGQIPAPVAQARWREQMEAQLGGVSSQRLPQPFWALAATAAWADLRLQQEVAQAIRQSLHRRVLLRADEIAELYPRAGALRAGALRAGALPSIAAPTFWLLLALARPAPGGRNWRPAQRRCRRAALQLRAVALALAPGPGWAGFWDQWLLLELLRQEPALVDGLPAALRQPLGRLPIWAAVPQLKPPGLSEVDTTAGPDWAAWAGPAPGWLPVLYHEEIE